MIILREVCEKMLPTYFQIFIFLSPDQFHKFANGAGRSCLLGTDRHNHNNDESFK